MPGNRRMGGLVAMLYPQIPLETKRDREKDTYRTPWTPRRNRRWSSSHPTPIMPMVVLTMAQSRSEEPTTLHSARIKESFSMMHVEDRHEDAHKNQGLEASTKEERSSRSCRGGIRLPIVSGSSSSHPLMNLFVRSRQERSFPNSMSVSIESRFSNGTNQHLAISPWYEHVDGNGNDRKRPSTFPCRGSSSRSISARK